MPVKTITSLTADQITNLEFRKGLRTTNSNDLINNKRYAIVLLEFDSAVTQGDYAAIKAAIVAMSEVDDAFLLVDHVTRASVPANHTQVLEANINIALRDDTP